MTPVLFGCAVALAFAVVPAIAHGEEAAKKLTIVSASLPLSSGEEQAKTLGRLRHRGTLRLTSPDENFGGISGLIVAADGGKFLAITDSSHWLTGTLHYRDGGLAAASGLEIAPLIGLDGKRISGKAGDAEGLTGVLDGDVYVSFEREHRIWRYDFGGRGLAARAESVTVPAEISQAPENGGLEGITLLADGRLLALSEEFTDSAGNYRAWLIAPRGHAPSQALGLKPRIPFKPTDVRALPGGDVLTVERRFNPIGGVGFTMRRIAGRTIGEGAVLDGEVVADAGMNFIIDNMEGLDVRTGSDGETLVYVVSDDNFNAPLQQTLIMMFELRN